MWLESMLKLKIGPSLTVKNLINLELEHEPDLGLKTFYKHGPSY